MAADLGINIQPQVEARIMRVLAPLSPAARRQQESPAALGQLLMTALADEAIARYQATGTKSLVVHRTATHGMRLVPLDAVATALAPALHPLPALAGAKVMAQLDAALWATDAGRAAVIAALDPGAGVLLAVVEVQERPATTRGRHAIRAPQPAAILPPALLTGWPDGVAREVVFARDSQGATVCYSVVSTALGSLGRIVLIPHGTQTEIRAEFLGGDPDPARGDRRETAFRVVAEAINRFLDQQIR